MSATSGPALHALALRAKARLPESVWRYLADGDTGDNDRALAAWHIVPRPLVDVRGGGTRLTLLGERLEHPILIAPLAYQALFHADAESGCAAAAGAQGSRMVLSSLSSQSFAAVAAAARQVQAPAPWFQLYWQGDRARTERLVERARQAGLSALVFTVDAPVKRATFELPDGVRAVNLDAERGPEPLVPGTSEVFDRWMTRAPTWDDVAWLRARWPDRPLLLKGILHPDDAERALGLGCDGIVVSNHGRRVLASAPPTAVMLPRVAARVAGRMTVVFDGGVRCGADVFVALALGADAVFVGRPALWGLAAEGSLGVARVLRLLRDELEMTMALAGCARLADITSERLLPMNLV